MIECVQLPSDVSQRVVVVSLDGLGALLPELAHLCLEARISVLALARPQYTPTLPRIRRLLALNPAHH